MNFDGEIVAASDARAVVISGSIFTYALRTQTNKCIDRAMYIKDALSRVQRDFVTHARIQQKKLD